MHGTKRRTRTYIAIAAALIVMVSVSAAMLRRDDARSKSPAAEKPAESQANAKSQPNDVVAATAEQLKQIRVEPVREQSIDLDLETTGKVGFNEDRMTPVFSPYSGRVVEVLVNKGDVVKAGQPLLVVESPDLISALNDLSEARAEADKAKIALDISDKTEQRARALNAQEALATKELQAAESDLAKARQDYRKAQTSVSVARSRLALFGKSPEEISQLEASTSEQVERRITVRAPIAGTIVERKVGPGQYIKPDMTDPLYLISDLSTVWMNADVYETYLPQIRVGAPAEIVVAAYPARKFPARIAAINPTLDPATRTVHVRCLVPNPDGALKPEMFANIRIGSAVKRTVPTVPSTAVLTRGADSFVLVEVSPAHFRRRAVKGGREILGQTLVEEGLGPTDRVVTSGVLLLNNLLDSK